MKGHGASSNLATSSRARTSFDARRSFEVTLSSSWVYRRTQHLLEDMSLLGSLDRETAWSALSDWSLADISILSVIALPILCTDTVSEVIFTSSVVSGGYDGGVSSSLNGNGIEPRTNGLEIATNGPRDTLCGKCHSVSPCPMCSISQRLTTVATDYIWTFEVR